VPEPLWVARLIVSQATRAKLSSKHNLNVDEVLDAIVWRYDTKLWMRDLKEGAAYLPK
jgi:hypothetical protein